MLYIQTMSSNLKSMPEDFQSKAMIKSTMELLSREMPLSILSIQRSVKAHANWIAVKHLLTKTHIQRTSTFRCRTKCRWIDVRSFKMQKNKIGAGKRSLTQCLGFWIYLLEGGGTKPNSLDVHFINIME